jgi:geranylgeranyl transferase type-2 subunit alpha
MAYRLWFENKLFRMSLSLTLLTGENKEQLEREIQVIAELLQEQPDSKCKRPCCFIVSATYSSTGSMESLVHYKRLLFQNHFPDSQALKQECVELLSRLVDLDPIRSFRYRDLSESLIRKHTDVLIVFSGGPSIV